MKIQDVELQVAIALMRPGRRFHFAGAQATGNDMSAIVIEDRAPEGEKLLTKEELPSESEVIAFWEKYVAERDAQNNTPEDEKSIDERIKQLEEKLDNLMKLITTQLKP